MRGEGGRVITRVMRCKWSGVFLDADGVMRSSRKWRARGRFASWYRSRIRSLIPLDAISAISRSFEVWSPKGKKMDGWDGHVRNCSRGAKKCPRPVPIFLLRGDDEISLIRENGWALAGARFSSFSAQAPRAWGDLVGVPLPPILGPLGR